MLDPQETIAAVATPSGPAFRAILRISGPQAIPIARAVFEPLGRSGWEPLGKTRRPVWVEGDLRVDGLSRPIPAAMSLWPDHRSYTGQPTVEWHLPGSPILVELALAESLRQGARRAEPGEFTLRAFLSGKLDLTQAEAVLGLIDAETPGQLEAALNQLAGGIGQPLQALRDRLLNLLAHLEATLDFVDEPDVRGIDEAALAQELAEAAQRLLELTKQLQERTRIDHRPRVVLVGRPNVGKSRLFNALLHQSAALVSDQSGTTRDYLSSPCACGDLEVELIDIAGLDEIDPDSGDPIAGEAQAMSRRQIELARLLVICQTGDVEVPPEFSPEAAHLTTLPVWTKADQLPPPADFPGCVTSAAEGRGLDDLKAAIARELTDDSRADPAPANTSARCRASLLGAAEALKRASQAVASQAGDELISIDLREAIDQLGLVVGAIVTDDILDRIFRQFCIGK